MVISFFPFRLSPTLLIEETLTVCNFLASNYINFCERTCSSLKALLYGALSDLVSTLSQFYKIVCERKKTGHKDVHRISDKMKGLEKVANIVSGIYFSL